MRMRRILLILFIAIVLLPKKPSEKDKAVVAAPLLVTAEPLPFDSSAPSVRSVGPLRWLGSWWVKSSQKEFGSISSMIVRPDGSLLGLSDAATLMGFRIDAGGGRQFIAPLPRLPEQKDRPNWQFDSESMVHDPVSGHYWVGFEYINMICRYSRGFVRVEACATPPAMQDWPQTGGAEAMARLPDGRFLVFSEKRISANGNDVLLFDGDPTDPATPAPIHLGYQAPQGFLPTDAVVLNNHRLLVLNRRLTLYDGFTGSIALVDLPAHSRAGTRLIGREIARLAPPVLADNYEVLALSKEGDRTILWVGSDDNFEFYQRTLILKFAVPPELLR